MNRTERFKLWAEYRKWPLGCYQLVIDAFEKGQLFYNDDQYASGMNSVAIGQYIYKIKIIIFNFLKKRINAELVASGLPALP